VADKSEKEWSLLNGSVEFEILLRTTILVEFVDGEKYSDVEAATAPSILRTRIVYAQQ